MVDDVLGFSQEGRALGNGGVLALRDVWKATSEFVSVQDMCRQLTLDKNGGTLLHFIRQGPEKGLESGL